MDKGNEGSGNEIEGEPAVITLRGYSFYASSELKRMRATQPEPEKKTFPVLDF